MKISILISVILHIVVLLTYPAIDFGRKGSAPDGMVVSFVDIPEESYSAIKEKLPDGGVRLNILSKKGVWEVPWPVIDIELLPEPEDTGVLLKKGDGGLPEMDAYEKETLLLTEDLDNRDIE